MAARTFLHVGTPKSGTSFLHGVLWRNAEALQASGLLLPGRMVAHYTAARSLTSTEPSDGTWSKLTRQVNRSSAQAFIGHPQLAVASAEQAAEALAEIEGEVHLVITARSLQLQPALSWQDQVKSGTASTFDAFLAGVRDQDRARGRRFWRVHDVVDLATRWRAGRITADHVHVVPVSPLAPPDGPGPVELWARYAGVLGLDPAAYDSDLSVSTRPLGASEIELLRRVHARRDPRFTDPQRHVWTRQLLAHDVLARRAAIPLRLPDPVLALLGERSAAIVAEIRSAGYDVAGDLADLERVDTDRAARLVTDVDDAEVADVAAWTILRLQEELVHREPVAPPPPVGPEDGIEAILELLEHIRAADSGTAPRPAPQSDPSRVARLRRALPARRPR